MRKFIQKISRQIIIVVLLFSLLTPNVAHAQMIVTDPLSLGQTIIEYILGLLKVVVRNVIVVGAVQLSQKVAQDAAESVATWVWEGAPGKNPLTYMKGQGDFIKDQASQALGDVLEQMSSDLQNANFLCIAVPNAPIGLLSGLFVTLNRPAMLAARLDLGRCEVGSIALNYRSLTNELSPSELLKQFNAAVTDGGSEMEQVVEAQFQALNAVITAQRNAEIERMATRSHQDQVTLISGTVIQPSSAVQEDSMINTVKFQAEQEAVQIAGILASGAEAIPAIFATTFANAISRKIMDKLRRGKGTNPTKKSTNLSNIFGAGKTAGMSTAGAIYSDIKTIAISGGDLDLLASFTACPDKYRQVDNCVIDSSFAAAIHASSAGKPLTVKEAMDQGKLHKDWELVSSSQTARNEDRLCSRSSYCYSNLTKLRKARIIPIGWEIAAETSDGSGKTTLGAVMKGFNQCAYFCSNNDIQTCSTDAECGSGTCNAVRDKQNPYCHLIDPNWVLRMPEHICRAKVFGVLPESDLSANRQEICTDQAACIQEDSSGQCLGTYGYCLREKNTFRFEADECPAQFAGCQSYGNKAFGDISLVDTTINSEGCTDKNTGCMAYIADYNAQGLFDTGSAKVYLNDKAELCTVQNLGCTEVLNAVSGKQQFLRLPPAGLGCKGLSNDPSVCKQYASACTVDEVGCEVYQPIGSSDPAIPGVITSATRDTNGAVVQWNDECAAECVGYASYYQATTRIEPVAAPATAFIPTSAQVCTQDVVGCDAYENIDTSAKGAGTTAYFAEPQKCSDPAVNSNHAVYYSWEGSDQSGYQLRQHDLVFKVEAEKDGPIYDVPAAQLIATNTACTANLYKARIDSEGKPNPLFNTDCRELFDKTGTPFYRLLSKTLPSTPECVAFRKEKSDQLNCAASNGKFDAVVGTCEYGFLPSASSQCTAPHVGCRAYNGSAALSPKIVLNESFSSADGWTGGTLSNEGITVGDSVLKITGAETNYVVSVTQDKTYNIVFWAKGQGSINIMFASSTHTALAVNNSPLVVGPDWRRYEVSSPPSAWTDAAAKLVFVKVSGSAFFLENVVVKEQIDVVYAVKDSWITPLSCDEILGDNIPGPALNCRAYKPKSQTNVPQVFLTGFTNLCRPQSAGCQKFVNTQNTQEITAREVSFGTAKRTIPADAFVFVIANSAASCPADKKGCSALGVTIDGKLETVAGINNPENYAEASCEVKDEWCQTFTGTGGTQRYFKYPDTDKRCVYHENKEVAGISYMGWFAKNTKTGADVPCYESFISGGNTYGIYKNQDTNYKGMTGMCEPKFNQCTEFIDRADVSKDNSGGQPYYFMHNNRLDMTSCSGMVSLKDGCAVLDDTSKGNKYISTLLTYCKSDLTTDPLCLNLLNAGKVPADARLKDGAAVGPALGPAEFNTHTMQAACSSIITSGLLVATDCESKLTKLASVFKQHNISFDGKAVICTSEEGIKNVNSFTEIYRLYCGLTGDANTIVKVRRDRTCAEWLSCKSSVNMWDSAQKKYRQVCTNLGVCNKTSSSVGNIAGCGNWIEPDNKTAIPLTTQSYVQRNVGWYGHEFSGYSLWDKFQVDRYGFYMPAGKKDIVMGVGFNSGCVNADNVALADEAVCTSDELNDKTNSDALKKAYGANVSLTGICYSNKCWYPIQLGQAITEKYINSSCRGYPEVDSPFSTSIVSKFTDAFQPLQFVSGYKQVNICEKYSSIKRVVPFVTVEKIEIYDENNDIDLVSVSDPQSCDCSYKRVRYSDASMLVGEKFYSLNSTTTPPGVCDGGWLAENSVGRKSASGTKIISKIGMHCSTDFHCLDERVVKNKYFTKSEVIANSPLIPQYSFGVGDGKCQFAKSISRVLGWEGYCLERDLRIPVNNSQTERACLSWLPIDAVGGFDLYNQYTSAGYQVKSIGDNKVSGALYCVNSTGVIQADGSNSVSQKFNGVLDGYGISLNKFALDNTCGDKTSHFNGTDSVAKWDSVGGMSSCRKLGKVSEAGLAHANALTIDPPDKIINIMRSELDYIEVVFGENPLIATGFKVRIIDDGKIRFHITQGFYDKNNKNGTIKCPASFVNAPLAYSLKPVAGDDFGLGVYDLFDKTFEGKSTSYFNSDLDGSGYDNGLLMEKLSYEARCPRPKDGSLTGNKIMPVGCDISNDTSKFYSKSSTKHTVGDYFLCLPGGVDKQNYPGEGAGEVKFKTTVTTGVTRTSYRYLGLGNSNYLDGDAVDIVNGNFDEMWYLRLDNRLHSRYWMNSNDNHSDDNHYDRTSGFGDRLTTYGLINNYGSDGSGTVVNVFDGSCSGGQDESHVGYELRFNFRQGKLNSVYAVVCDSGFDDDEEDHIKGKVVMPVTIKYALRNQCKAIVAVTSDPILTVAENKAFTDRVWSGPTFMGIYKQVDSEAILFKTDGKQQIEKKRSAAPFGSFISTQTPSLYGVQDYSARSYWFTNILNIKYVSNPTIYYYNNGTAPVFDQLPVDGAVAYGCPIGKLCIKDDVGKNFPAEGDVSVTVAKNTILNNLFAKIYRTYGEELSSGEQPTGGGINGSYLEYIMENKPEFDVSNLPIHINAYPSITAFDPTKCVGPGSCQLTRGMAMVVNSEFRLGESVVGKKLVPATLQFYGWADRNHMPLRRVMVDWSDGSNLAGNFLGKYRNHKAVCSKSDKPAPFCWEKTVAHYNMTCSTNADCINIHGQIFGDCRTADSDLMWSFGNWAGNGTDDDGACVEQFFQFSHAYTFSPICKYPYGDHSALGINPTGPTTANADNIKALKLEGKVGLTERFCVYRPKVQLRDNWDVCNGVVSSSDFTPKGYGGIINNQSLCQVEPNAYTPFQGYIVVKE